MEQSEYSRWATLRANSLYLLLLIVICLWACQPAADDLTRYAYAPTAVTPPQPAGFVPMIVPADNPLTVEGIDLGRRLFFDPILSANRIMNCASCHQPKQAFTDGLSVAQGMGGRLGRRSAPSLLNVGFYYQGLFWDGRVKTLEEQALHPVRDTMEMASVWTGVGERLQRHPDYPRLFRAAFGISTVAEIDSQLVTKALAQYQRTLVSATSKYDSVLAKQAAFTASEQRGRDIFFDASEELPHSECGHCHLDPLFTNLDFANNGIDEAPTLTEFADKGLGEVTGQVYQNGMFRVPTLRNIAITAPYMHDGRFATLGQVVDHYVSGGHYAENVNPNVRLLLFKEQDKLDLIAFLHTLTDSTALQSYSSTPPPVEFTLEK